MLRWFFSFNKYWKTSQGICYLIRCFPCKPSLLTFIYILHLSFGIEEREEIWMEIKGKRKKLFYTKQTEMYANKNSVVVIKMLPTSFCWTNTQGKIFWQALKWMLLPGGDDALIPVKRVWLKCHYSSYTWGGCQGVQWPWVESWSCRECWLKAEVWTDEWNGSFGSIWFHSFCLVLAVSGTASLDGRHLLRWISHCF